MCGCGIVYPFIELIDATCVFCEVKSGFAKLYYPMVEFLIVLIVLGVLVSVTRLFASEPYLRRLI